MLSDAYDFPDAYDAPTDYDGALSAVLQTQASGIPSKKREFTLREKLPDTDWHKIERERRQRFDKLIAESLAQRKEEETSAPENLEVSALTKEETPPSPEKKQLFELELLLLSQFC